MAGIYTQQFSPRAHLLRVERSRDGWTFEAYIRPGQETGGIHVAGLALEELEQWHEALSAVLARHRDH